MSQPEQTTTEWCAGLPLVQERPLEDEERKELEHEKGLLRQNGLVIVLRFAAVVCIFAIAATHIDSSIEINQTGLTLDAILLLGVGLPVTILMTRDSLRRRQGITQDLTVGTAKRFAGMRIPKMMGDDMLLQLQEAMAVDTTLLELQQAKLIPNESTAEWSFEILAASRRVWKVEDQHIKSWIVTNPIVVAHSPPFAAIAAQWLQPISTPNGKLLLVGRRELSQAEGEELLRYAHRMRLRPLPYTACFTLWLCVPIMIMLLQGRLNSQIYWLQFIFLAVITAINYIWLIHSIRLSRKLRKDVQARYVAIFRAATVQHSKASKKATRKQSTEPEVNEVLLVSKRRWTVDGGPTRWRIVS